VSATRSVPSRRGRPWDEQSIRSGLSEFLQGWEVWPTYEQFIQGGAKGLRDALARIGGVQYWAKQMGLPGGDRPLGGVRVWTDDAIHHALADFFGDRPDWPSQREFDEAGLHALREALRHYGGPERWARELGVVLPAGMARSTARPRQPPATPANKPARMWPPWDEPRIAAELEVFLRGREEWPRYREFIQSRHKALYQAVLRHGGTHAWAKRMGVKWVNRHDGRNRYWTEERVREQLAVFLAARSHWPAPAEFHAAEQGRLLRAISATGGVEKWACEFGLQRAPRASRRASTTPKRQARRRRAKRTKRPRRWDDERIEAAIAPLVVKLGRWPTKSEFHRAGLGNALSAVYDHGGSRRWQQRLGVGPSPFTGSRFGRRVWSEERIDSELRDFCEGRSDWPSRREFESRKATALYYAARAHGGLASWRERLGLG
jgi:hypothetical protein